MYKSAQPTNVALIAGVTTAVVLVILGGISGGVGWYCKRRTAKTQQQPDVTLPELQHQQQLEFQQQQQQLELHQPEQNDTE